MTEQTRKITCMEYYAELYASDDSDVPIIDYTTGSDALTVNNLLAAVDIKTQPDGTTAYNLAVSWRLPREAVAKQIKVEYRKDWDTEYTTQGVYDGSATSTVIAGVAASISYTVRVTCYNDLGLAGGAATQTIYTAPKRSTPSKVQDFAVVQDSGNSSVLQLSWKANPETDILGYRLFDGTGAVLVDLIGGTSHRYFIPASGTYTFAVKAVNRSGVLSVDPAEASVVATVAASSVAVPDAPKDLRVWMEEGVVRAEWSPVTNTYIDFYEVFPRDQAGRPRGSIEKTTGIRCNVTLGARVGRVSVRAHNPQKGYGEARYFDYNFPLPEAPKIRLTKTMHCFNVNIFARPVGVKGTCVYLSHDGVTETIETTGSFVSYSGAPGIYSVRAAFLDALGEGILSQAEQVVVAVKIDKAAIEGLTITQQDLDAALKKQLSDMQTTADTANTTAGNAAKTASAAQTTANNAHNAAGNAGRVAAGAQTTANAANTKGDTALSQIKKTNESITSIVAKLSGNPQNSGYSAITQLYSGLQLKVAKGEVVSAINVAPAGVRIDGRLLHITGNTQFDGNIIANRMLQAGAVTADKLSVGSLSAISANIGLLRTKTAGERVEMENNQIRVYDANNKLRVRMGVW